MYESLTHDRDNLHLLREGRHDPVRFHDGPARKLLDRHRRHVGAASRGELPDPGPYLLRRIADARTLYLAWADLRRSGGDAPGPDGLRASNLGDRLAWSLARSLAGSIRDGSYRPGAERRVEIPKGGGGTRTLTIQNVRDRVVGRAAHMILEPVLDPGFMPFSFGWRPGRGRADALATVMELAEQQGRWTWVVADIGTAFDVIPVRRLLDVCRTRFPQDVVNLIETVARTAGRRGVRQGSPLSPLLVNLFFDRAIDRAWYRRHPGVPLVRTADDLLILCRDEAEAADALVAMKRIATGAGTPLKESGDHPVRRLEAGEVVEWLGYRLQRRGQALAIEIGDRPWERLTEAFALAHESTAAPLIADDAVRGWLGQLGPMWGDADRDRTIEHVLELGDHFALDELPGAETLSAVWSAAHARWCLRYREQAELLASRLHDLDRWLGQCADGSASGGSQAGGEVVRSSPAA